MSKILSSSLLAFAALLIWVGAASACPGAKGTKKYTVDTSKADRVVVAITLDKSTPAAVKLLQDKVANKTKDYNAGKAVCSQCSKAKACMFKVPGVKLASKNLKNGVELTATGSPAALKDFAEVAKARAAAVAKGGGSCGAKGSACADSAKGDVFGTNNAGGCGGGCGGAAKGGCGGATVN